MTDIVTQLREAAALSLNEYGEADRYLKAANEIERQTRRIDQLEFIIADMTRRRAERKE